MTAHAAIDSGVGDLLVSGGRGGGPLARDQPEEGWLDDGPLDDGSPDGNLPDRGEAPLPVGRGDSVSGVVQRIRSGRFDPGLQGAAVLVGVALLAGALSAWFLLGSRPAAVPVPPPSTTVEAPGVAPGEAGSVEVSSQADAGPAAGPAGAAPTAVSPSGAEVVVAVAGTVARPGVVRLPAGSRVVDAVDAAGGVLPGADPGLLNLARVLADGEQVLVGVEPPAGAAAQGSPTGGGHGGGATAGAVTADGRLDINRAGVADLDALPGVGPVLAQRIVEHRDGIGRFASIEQLGEVAGIGDSRYAELEPLVVVP